jgi:peptidoglycan-associated lipoprotein
MSRNGILLTLLLCACSSQSKAPTVPTAARVAAIDPGSGDAATTKAPSPDAEEQPQVEPVPKLHLGPVYFAYDEALLSDEARAELQRAGYLLGSHPELRVLLTGHTDERGTVEYNLALGDQRARVCRDYLSRLGIDGERIRTLTYGEARPAASGSDDTAWSKNRRVEFELSR